jgi:hypothetical protein
MFFSLPFRPVPLHRKAAVFGQKRDGRGYLVEASMAPVEQEDGYTISSSGFRLS